MGAGTESTLTPEVARRLAAELAPHLIAMRAVTAGTRYAGIAATPDLSAAPDLGAAPDPAVSPATRIFIAGMLDRISA